MANVMRFIIFLLLVLFCWGWISNVGLGRLTTGEYIYKIANDFRQGIMNTVEEISKAQKGFMYNLRERAY
jgi:hypothetical protein